MRLNFRFRRSGREVAGRSSKPMLLPTALFIPFALILAVCGCTGGSDTPPEPYANTIAQMTTYIENSMAQSNVTGLSIALVDGQNVVWSRGFGYADKEANVPAAADTIYEIGSLSKTFAATAIMRLVEEGRMDIDQPLTTYLPGFSINQRFPQSGPITIRAILTHHSGIPGDLFNGAFTEGQPFDYDTWLLDILKNEYTAAPVGSVLAYSNSAIALLRPVIEAAARMMQIFDTTIPNGGPTFPDDSPLVTNYQIVATPGDGTLWLKARGYSGWERMDLKPLFLR